MNKNPIIYESGKWYIIKIDNMNGITIDLDHKRIFPAYNIISLLARGYWDEYTGDEKQKEYLLSLAKKASNKIVYF